MEKNSSKKWHALKRDILRLAATERIIYSDEQIHDLAERVRNSYPSELLNALTYTVEQVDVAAFSEDEARTLAEQGAPKGSNVERVEIRNRGSKGFLWLIGRHPHSYSVMLKTPQRQTLEDLICLISLRSRLRDEREDKGLTIKQVASQLKVHQSKVRCAEATILLLESPDVRSAYFEVVRSGPHGEGDGFHNAWKLASRDWNPGEVIRAHMDFVGVDLQFIETYARFLGIAEFWAAWADANPEMIRRNGLKAKL